MAGEKLQSGGVAAFNQTIFTSAVIASATTTVGDKIIGTEGYTSMLVQATVSAIGGASPTVNIYVQTLLPDGATWNDMISMTQLTANGTKLFWHVAGAAGAVVVNDGALAAGTAAPNGLCGPIRVKVITAGTFTTATVVVNANFLS